MQDLHKQRQFVLQGLVVLASIALVFRCFQLQVLNPGDANYAQEVTVYPARGMIFDRNGKQFVNNEATYDLMVTYSLVKDIDTAKFCDLLSISKEDFLKNLKKDFKNDRRFSTTAQYPFTRNIAATAYANFSESNYEFPGFDGVLRNVRGYAVHCGAHVLGYISEVTPDQVKDNKDIYKAGDYIGSSGLELTYEEQLRGSKGISRILKDNLGRLRGSYRNGADDIAAQSGLHLVSTLDIDLQAYGEDLMRNKKGAIVAIEPSTGEILALVSSPTYDPNLLTINKDRGDAFNNLNSNDSLKPLLNRAVLAKYPPGSTFKPVMALIGLQEGVLTPDRAIPCRGGYHMQGHVVGCHGHAMAQNPAQAIQHSCNAYFCQTFREVVEKYETPTIGLQKVVDWAHTFGLGIKLNSDISSESQGNIPTPGYYDKMYGKGRWYATSAISLGIGQGEIEATPLQMANVSAIIANRGYFYTPHLVREFKSSEDVNDKIYAKSVSDKVLSRFKEKHLTGVDTSYYTLVVQGMEDVVLAGTATRSRIHNISMCGKTGTVENPHGKDHSTFIAFAPKDNPQIAICVFVENSGFGATYAAPIASLMIEKYLTGEIEASRKALETRIKTANLLK